MRNFAMCTIMAVYYLWDFIFYFSVFRYLIKVLCFDCFICLFYFKVSNLYL